MAYVYGAPILMSVSLLCVSHAGQHPSKERPVASHRQGRADPGGLQPADHPLHEPVGRPEALGQEDRGGPAGKGLPMRKGSRRTLTPLMACILAVAYPDLDGHLKVAQQPQGSE
ncbi:hypothetical protein NDU88_003284 [Pleurodeles waltl]|uniref:Uncharacterized protein n=1 Tax=Pleurodeles waltl TaxID=8319 RepID=A0AAV7W6Y3_PLEWA|nr:hypothetical protein NDU88_003284 [Pleurodeles waltl]